MKKKLLIIDGNAIVHRAYHALPPLKNKKGELVNAVYGFCLIFLKALKDIEPDFVVSTFDVKGPTFRHKQFKQYKAKRKKAPDELYDQIKGVKKVLTAFDIPFFEKAGFEADDLIGTIAKESKRKQVKPKIENIILTGDMDALQLVDEQTKVYGMRKGIKDIVLYDIDEVKEKYQGLIPEQLTDYRALRGDPSDNIPGVTGIGEKTAINLLNEFKDLDNIYSSLDKIKESISQKLSAYKDQALISQKLAEIDCNVEIDFNLKKAEFDFKKEKVIEVFQDFGFKALLSRIPGQEIAQTELFEKSILKEIKELKEKGAFSKKIASLEENLIPIVEEMEKNGIKADHKCLNSISLKLEKEIQDLEKEIYKLSKTNFNINSPSQLVEILFEKLKISPLKVKKTPKGAISTNAKELKKIKNEHPIVPLILKYRELFKLKTGFVDSLPRMINPKTGRIHPHFHQLGTETGRMSCSNPNLQNIPIKRKDIRKCFLAEKGFEFLSVDYSQMELRVAAFISKDKKMLDFFKQGRDIHTQTAISVFGDKDKRDMAKALNFGVLYGMGPNSFSERTGLDKKQAKEFIKKYFIEFKELHDFLEDQKEKTREEGFAETMFGRKRFLPEINSQDHRMRAQAERMAINMPMQGTSADIMKMAMLKVKKVLPKSDKLLLQIHDELLFETKDAKKLALKVKKAMEDTEIPLKVEIKIGPNWGELKKV